MRVAILHTPVAPDAPPEDQDGLVQVEAVSKALSGLGHDAVAVPFGLNLEAARETLAGAEADCVFNLVESVDGNDRLILLAPALLETMGLPFTGASLESMFLTTNKIAAKKRLCASGLPTPDLWDEARLDSSPPPPEQRVIVKSAWDHGSKGLEEDSVLFAAESETVKARLRRAASLPGQTWFAESYIDGREINVGILDGPQGPDVLPPAEIRFEDFGPGRPRVVGYRAKWAIGSSEYAQTVRSFEFTPEDAALLAETQRLALACWSVFDLRGWARVDFRVDPSGTAWILEVNANPCLSPDAGFAAAVERAGLAYNDAIGRILVTASA